MKFVVVLYCCNNERPFVYDVITVDDALVEQLRNLSRSSAASQHFGVEDIDELDSTALYDFRAQQIKDIQYTGRMKAIIDEFAGKLFYDYRYGFARQVPFTVALDELNPVSFVYDVPNGAELAKGFFNICPCRLTLAFIELRDEMAVSAVTLNMCPL